MCVWVNSLPSSNAVLGTNMKRFFIILFNVKIKILEKKLYLKEIAAQLYLILLARMGDCKGSSKLICIYIDQELFRAGT